MNDKKILPITSRLVDSSTCLGSEQWYHKSFSVVYFYFSFRFLQICIFYIISYNDLRFIEFLFVLLSKIDNYCLFLIKWQLSAWLRKPDQLERAKERKSYPSPFRQLVLHGHSAQTTPPGLKGSLSKKRNIF